MSGGGFWGRFGLPSFKSADYFAGFAVADLYHHASAAREATASMSAGNVARKKKVKIRMPALVYDFGRKVTKCRQNREIPAGDKRGTVSQHSKNKEYG